MWVFFPLNVLFYTNLSHAEQLPESQKWLFPNECMAIFAGFIEDHQLIGSVCVKDVLKPLLLHFIVMLCCGMVPNFACEVGPQSCRLSCRAIMEMEQSW